MMTLLTNQADDYLFGEYRGRHFGLLRHHGNWRVLLDQRLLEHYIFETAEEANTWLRQKIEGRFNRQ
jgi:hypothetical protein